jgi:hypothetical protein
MWQKTTVLNGKPTLATHKSLINFGKVRFVKEFVDVVLDLRGAVAEAPEAYLSDCQSFKTAGRSPRPLDESS